MMFNLFWNGDFFMIKIIRSYFTLKFHRYCFRDVVSGKDVNIYIDCYGYLYMKDNRWSFFSVFKGRV